MRRNPSAPISATSLVDLSPNSKSARSDPRVTSMTSASFYSWLLKLLAMALRTSPEGASWE